MRTKLLTIGAVVLATTLGLATIAAWLAPGNAEAAQRSERGRQVDSGERQGEGSWQSGDRPVANENEGRYGGGQGQRQGSSQDQGAGQGQSQGQGQGQAPVDHTPIWDDAYDQDLSQSEVEALLMALDDEYKAWTVYDQVISDLGAARPFTSIQRAEENHIAALETLLDHYGLETPPNEWAGNVPTFDTLAEACEMGVEAEVENAALYDRLFAMVDNPDIIQVFTSLQQASQTKHLPAFERCAQ